MITDVEYMQIVNEAYDLSDYATKKKVLFCNEAKKVDNIEHIVNTLYVHIKNNVSGIDFGTIPKSRGVITRVENYAELLECINSVEELVHTYKERTDILDELTTAIANVQQRERIFTKAFALNIEFPIMIYNITVLSIVSAVSLLLSSTIEYVKNGHDSFNVSFDKVGYSKSREHVLYEYIVQFNRNCNTGLLDKLMSECVRNNLTPVNEADFTEEELAVISEAGGLAAIGKILNSTKNAAEAGGTVGKVAGEAIKIGKKVWNSKLFKFGKIVVAIGAGLIALLWVIRKATFGWMKLKMNVSDWFAIQAQYLQINAENLKYRDDNKGDDHRRQVYQNQMKWVERFKRIANDLALKDAKTKKDTEDYDREGRKQQYEDNEDEEGLF